MDKRKSGNYIPYIKISLQLDSCIKNTYLDPFNFKNKLKSYLIEKLDPDFNSDIELDIEESAGWRNEYGDKDEIENYLNEN